MIDRGTDWLKKASKNSPDGLLITHAHPDHAAGLKNGFSAPVYATAEAWETMNDYDIKERVVIEPRHPFAIGPFIIEAFPVHHSIHAPAVGYRIRAGKRTLFYVPDLISIIDEKSALKNINLYIGDGAIITRTLLVRQKDHEPVGHSPIKEQLEWCKKNKVHRAIFTHCGTEIVTGNTAQTKLLVKELGTAVGVRASVAYDAMHLML